jgi:hypothetical protein
VFRPDSAERDDVEEREKPIRVAELEEEDTSASASRPDAVDVEEIFIVAAESRAYAEP